MRNHDMPNHTYTGTDRREGGNHMVLTEDQIDAIAKKAAAEAVSQLTDHVYRQIGKGVVTKLFWLVGALSVGLYMLLKSKGVIS